LAFTGETPLRDFPQEQQPQLGMHGRDGPWQASGRAVGLVLVRGDRSEMCVTTARQPQNNYLGPVMYASAEKTACEKWLHKSWHIPNL